MREGGGGGVVEHSDTVVPAQIQKRVDLPSVLIDPLGHIIGLGKKFNTVFDQPDESRLVFC